MMRLLAQKMIHARTRAGQDGGRGETKSEAMDKQKAGIAPGLGFIYSMFDLHSEWFKSCASLPRDKPGVGLRAI